MLKRRNSSQGSLTFAAVVFVLTAAMAFLLDENPARAQNVVEPKSKGVPSADPAWLSLNYTGALFGYYRIEPDDKDQEMEALGPVHEFMKQRKNNPGLLLGMGDNFGPEFGASVQREFPGDHSCYLPAKPPWPEHRNVPPEIIYKMERRLPRKAECDNVARFLMKAGYSAIVPGKEDFLYSARWLREIAVLFRGAPDPNKPVDGLAEEKEEKHRSPLMLAANVRLNFKVETNTAASIVDKQKIGKQTKGDFGHSICPLLFSWDPLGSATDTCVKGVDNGDTVTTEMDWLRRLDSTQNFDSKSGEYPVAAAMIAQARQNRVFRRQLLENESQIVLATLSKKVTPDICPGIGVDLQSLGKALRTLGTDSAFEKLNGESSTLKLSTSKDVTDSLLVLSTLLKECPGGSTELNNVLTELSTHFANASSNSLTAEFLFSPEARRGAIHLLLRKIAAEQRNIGYTISGGTLVIGVMGPETMRAVSPTNLRLCTVQMGLDLEARTQDIHACDDWIEAQGPGGNGGLFPGRLVGTVVVGDPVLAVTTVVRAAWEYKSKEPFDRVVVMAQMPRTEAEELAAHVLINLQKTSGGQTGSGNSADFTEAPHVDLILSEAQQDHISPEMNLGYLGKSLIPVVTPKPAGKIGQDGKGLVDPVSLVTIRGGQYEAASKRLLVNHTEIESGPGQSPTMADVLYKQLGDGVRNGTYVIRSWDWKNLKAFWDKCKDARACENSVMMQFLLEQIHRSSHADVVLLEYRDFYFGPLLDEYSRPLFGEHGRNDICDDWRRDHATTVSDVDYCRLRVALDRVLWKGDYSERVMVDGKTLKSALALAKQETTDEQSLAARDTVDEWLMTYGIVAEPPKNLSGASIGPDTFAVPGENFCKNDGSDEGQPQYCVNLQKVSDDGAYWVSTSDHLAQDSQLYKVFNSLDSKYHEKKKELFITGEIADEITERNSKGTSKDLANAADAHVGMSGIEEAHQDRPVTQLDYAKVVAGFMFRKPDKSNTQLGTDFAGVADSRATTPSTQEVDLEAMTRVTRGLGVKHFWHDVKIGIQSDLESDRAVAGNTTGNPETVTYALNSFTAGGFVQYRFLSHKFLPQSSRFLLVVAPYQYQRQVTGNYLNFKFTTPPGQITVATPAARGFAHRLGGRWEFGGSWTGSYAETGPEYSDTHNLLSELILPNGALCDVSAASFTSCFTQNSLVITSKTVLTPHTATLHAGGWYWDVHLQKPLDKGKRTSLTIETKGDDFAWTGFTLPTQSQYAFTTTGALNFAVIGNFVFSPTYTTFFYSNEGTRGNPSHNLVTNTVSVTAKWYFDRDAAVPFWRQLWFQGPASLDQTKSAKIK